jgi:cell division protein ZipA
MNTLFLIIIATIIIASIIMGLLLIWKRKPRRRRRRKKPTEMADRPEGDLYADRYFEENPISPSSVGSVDPLFDTPFVENTLESDSKDTSLLEPTLETKTNKGTSLETKADLEASLETKADLEVSSETKADSQANMVPEPTLQTESPKKELPKKADRKSEMIIVLYVIAKRETGFTGMEILTVLEDLGLKHGEMNIYHHYGFGDSKLEQPIFSVANVVEPGTFNPQKMVNFSTTGLALFMRLPGPFGGRVAFELMLNSATKMAEKLEGTVEDERHIPLTQKLMTALRDRIANFEQRSTHLSILKRFS